MLIPEATLEQQQWFNEAQHVSVSQENAAASLEVMHELDVTSHAEMVQVPTLVFHAHGDAHVPFDEGKYLAALIPTARFVPLDSRNHVLLEAEPAWSHFVAELRAFLAETVDNTSVPRRFCSEMQLTPAETQVLGLLARGLPNTEIAGRLGKSEKTVRNQVSSVFSKLRVRTRAEAVALARDTGIGEPL
jgi:DNA-binding CsgD family transcriptional regulator